MKNVCKTIFLVLFTSFTIITTLFLVIKNVRATSLFSDNFDDNSIDGTLWTEVDVPDYITETGGKISLSDSGVWGATALISSGTFPRAASTTFSATVNLSHPYVMFGFKDSGAVYSYLNMVYGIYFYDGTAGGGGNRQLFVYEDGTSKGEKGLGWSLNTDYTIAIMLKSTGARYYIQGGIYGTIGTNDWTLLYDSSYSSESSLRVGFTSKDDSNTGNIMTMNDVSVVDTALPISVILKNQMISKPTSNGMTLLFKTNVPTNLTLDYGLTDSYGTTYTDTNLTMHEINLSGLAEATTYHYRAILAENANTDNNTTTLDSTFKTSISSTTSFVAGMITDTQGCNFSNVVSQLQSLNPDIILSSGDNMMGESATTVGTFRYRWGIDFFDYIQALTNHIPLYTAFGNHDGVVSSYTAGSQAYNAELAMPTSTSGGELYYSFDYGPAHFAVLNGSSLAGGIIGTIDATQLAWLEADLQATTQPHKIVLGHYMVYGADDTIYTASTSWQYSNYQAVHAVLRDNGVLAYISGHRHTFNRYVKDGVYYITNPAAGAEWCTLDPLEFGPGNYANTGGDTGTLANAIGYYPGYTKLSVTASRVSAITYKDDGTTLAEYDLIPTNFELSSPSDNSYTNDSTPTLSWNASSDNAAGISKYQIYVDGALALDNISSGATSATLTSAIGEGAHTWYVKAVNAAGWSTQSNSTYTINLDSTAPAEPVITTSPQTVNSASITIVGTAVADSTITISGGSSSANGTATGGNFSISVPLTQDAVNTLSVTASDAYFNTSTADTVAITEDSTAPSAPGQMTSSTAITTSSLRIAYGAESTDLHFNEYKIFYKAGSSGVSESDTEINSTTDSNLGSRTFSSATSTLISGLSINTQYVINIWAYDTLNNNVSSTQELVLYTGASVPSGVSASASGNTITVAFSGDATQYYVVDANDSGRYSTWSTSLSRSFSDLTCGTSYTFKVKGNNGDGYQTDYSDSVSATTASCPVTSSGGGGFVAPSSPMISPSVNSSGSSNSMASINLNALNTSDRLVRLFFYVDNVVNVAISNSPDFAGISFEPYLKEKLWKLPEGTGEKTVYLRFRSKDGGTVDTTSVINLINEPQKTSSITKGITTATSPKKDTTLLKNNLYYGNKSSEVSKLQQKLYIRGYLKKNDVVGIFGPKTLRAVRKLQKDNNISATGNVGPLTTNLLNKILK